MTDINDLSGYKHHDNFFKKVFKVKAVARQFVQKFLPLQQLAVLELNSLELSSDHYITDESAEHLTDLVYTCMTKDAEEVRICLLFEHKSNTTGRKIYTQIGKYLLDIQEEDIKQKREYFTLTIPILFYHGEDGWNVRPLFEMYGNTPVELESYKLNFGILCVALRDVSDEWIVNMQDTLLLRNVLLAFKHARNVKLFKIYFRETLIFADENEPKEVLLSLFDATFFYVRAVSSVNKNDFMEMVQSLPKQYETRAKTLYEQILDEGIEKGIEQGLSLAIKKYMTASPSEPDAKVAALFDVPLTLIAAIRKELANFQN